MARIFIRNTLVMTFTTLLIVLSSISAKKAIELKEEKMSLYLQDYAAGPNATAVAVAGIAGKLWTFTQIGTVFVTDDLITQTSDPNSARLGRSQGTYVMSSLDGQNLHVTLSLVFTHTPYNGSSIEIQGTYKQFEPARTEVAVVGGTGKFRFARGYATFETYSFDSNNSHATLRLNVTLLKSYCK